MLEKLTVAIASSLLLLLMAPVSVSAGELKEIFWILSDSWKITETNSKTAPPQPGAKTQPAVVYPNFTVEVQSGGKVRKYSVNMRLLAQTTHTDTAGAVSYQLKLTDYLKGLKSLSKADILIKLGTEKQNGLLEVVGVWQFNSQQAWNRATNQGSEIMNLSAPQVRKFGSADAYKAELIKRTQSQWAQLDSRKNK